MNAQTSRKPSSIQLRSRTLTNQSVAPATIRAYETALRALDAWLDGRPLTDETFAEYQRYRSDTDMVSYATLEVARAAIRFNAKLARVQSPDGPETGNVLKCARSTNVGRGRRQVAGVR